MAKQQAAAVLVTCSRLLIPDQATGVPPPLAAGQPEPAPPAPQEPALAAAGAIASLPVQAIAGFAESQARHVRPSCHQDGSGTDPASRGSVGLWGTGSCTSQPAFDVRLRLDFWPLLQQLLVRAVP